MANIVEQARNIIETKIDRDENGVVQNPFEGNVTIPAMRRLEWEIDLERNQANFAVHRRDDPRFPTVVEQGDWFFLRYLREEQRIGGERDELNEITIFESKSSDYKSLINKPVLQEAA